MYHTYIWNIYVYIFHYGQICIIVNFLMRLKLDIIFEFGFYALKYSAKVRKLVFLKVNFFMSLGFGYKNHYPLKFFDF